MASRSQWDETIKAVQGMGYPQNPAAPPAPRPNSFGDAAAAMGNPGTVQPRSTFGSMAAQAATPAAPVAPAVPAARSVSPSGLYFQDRGQELKDQVGQGQYAQALGTAARTAVQGAGMYALEAGDKLTSPWLDAARSFGRGVAGAPANAAPARPAPPAPAAPAAPNPTDQRLAAGTQAAPMGLAASALESPPAAPAAPTAPATPSNQVMPGVFNHGRGQYSDQAGGMGMPSSFTGQPTQQSLNAAQRLSDSQGLAARAMQQQAQQPGFSGVIGQQGGNGNMWGRTPDQQRRDAEVQASSIHRPTAERGSLALRALDMQDVEGVRGANALAQEGLRGRSSLAQEALRQDGGLQREGMQQAGASQRSMVQAMLEQQKINQAGETAGYANRAAAQTEQLRNTLLNPQSTPEQRKQAQSALLALQGKQENADAYLVVPGGQQIDQVSGRAYNTPSSVFNRQTGQWVQQPGQGEAPQYEVGKVYTNAKGERARRTETGWAPP